jgi:hypothetical protein
VPASRPVDELRRVATGLILDHLKKTTVIQAAADLRISRQAIYGIKRGDFCPSLTLIQRACEIWEIEFNFRNLKIAKGTLSSKQAKVAPAPPTQLELFEALRHLQNQTAQIVETKRMGRDLELTFRFEISA